MELSGGAGVGWGEIIYATKLEAPLSNHKSKQIAVDRTKRSLVKAKQPQNVSCSGQVSSPRLGALSRGREGSDVDANGMTFFLIAERCCFLWSEAIHFHLHSLWFVDKKSACL
jgi:hypothetical protein